MGADCPTPEQKPDGEAWNGQPGWWHLALCGIGDAVITTDANGCITFLNPVAQSLTGWTKEEALGQPLTHVFKIIDEESRLSVRSTSGRALHEGIVVDLANHRLLTAQDGTERPLDGSASPMRNADSEVTGVVLVFRDMSERKREEEATQEAIALAEIIRPEAVRDSVSAALQDCQRRHPHVGGCHRDNHRRQPVYGRPVGVLREIPSQRGPTHHFVEPTYYPFKEARP
jgi:PAS domain S-box-containing protein